MKDPIQGNSIQNLTAQMAAELVNKKNEFTRLVFTKIFPEEVVAIMDAASNPLEVQANCALVNQLGLQFEIERIPEGGEITRIVRHPRNKKQAKVVLAELAIKIGVECKATISIVRGIDQFKHSLWSPVIRRWLRAYACQGNRIAKQALEATKGQFFGIDYAAGPDKTVRIERGEILEGGRGESEGTIPIPCENLETHKPIAESEQLGDSGLPPCAK